ncbi:hypothetical protein [Kitasatospora cineracea]|uniref:Uncharacterized protein n=1 Tax=Kitasatospora cineracea TaxID=88074 RepID=A0A8G1XFQ2_9ACTN|nr:hypothetical protein [Kitasatospora cineracea]ROR44122.1 hypothetical protein EDD39_2295 [Kitasatospora cineracea]
MSGEGEELSVRMARYVAVEEAAAPPSRVDPALAALQGRAVLRRRRWTVVAAAAAVVLSAGSFAVLGPGGGADPAGPRVSRQGASPSGGISAPPVTRRTVLTAPARFGWLPDSVTAVEYRSGAGGSDVVAEVGAAGSAGWGQFVLTAFPEGVTPDVDPLIGTGDGQRIAAPPVNGQEAYWVSSSDPAFAARMDLLRFRGADGIWYQLDSSGLAEADRQSVPLRIAAGVVVGRYAPAMPLALSSLPADTVVTRASLRRTVNGQDLWRAEVGLQQHGSHDVTVSAEPGGGDAYVPPNSQSTGEAVPPGSVAPMPDQAACSSGGGVRRCVREVQPGSDADASLTVWLDRVVSRGTDDAGWSVDVLP